jgi:hypothetical protein
MIFKLKMKIKRLKRLVKKLLKKLKTLPNLMKFMSMIPNGTQLPASRRAASGMAGKRKLDACFLTLKKRNDDT